MTKSGRIMLSSKCAVFGGKKLTFIKEKKTSRLFCSLRLKTLLRQVPTLGPILF